MYLGLSVFAGADELNVLQLIELRLGPFPQQIVDRSPRSFRYFDAGRVRRERAEVWDEAPFERFPLERLRRAKVYPSDPAGLREALLDLILRMLEVEPEQRITPQQIFDHRFLTGA